MSLTTYTAPFEIIMAEENPANVGLVREAIHENELNCRLRVIRDGGEALTLIGNLDADPNVPALDLLLLDMHLPKRDGGDIRKRLRSTERSAQMPVIVLTWSRSSIIEEMGARHAALVYFKEPHTLAEFVELGAIIRRVPGRAKKQNEPENPANGKNGGCVE